MDLKDQFISVCRTKPSVFRVTVLLNSLRDVSRALVQHASALQCDRGLRAELAAVHDEVGIG